MSSYIKDDNAQIYADYIKRLGEILETYKGEYEVSLCISILQSILLSMKENVIYQVNKKSFRKGKNIFGNIEFAEKNENIKILTSGICNNTFFYFEERFILNNTLHQKPTYINIFESMRNAIAHPRRISNKKEFSNGFTVEQNKNIEFVNFINKSPIREDNKYIEISIPIKSLYKMTISLSEFVYSFLMNHENPKKALREFFSNVA